MNLTEIYLLEKNYYYIWKQRYILLDCKNTQTLTDTKVKIEIIYEILS